MKDQLFLFNSPRIRYAGTSDCRGMVWSRQAALISYLASEPEWHSRASIAELFRPDANAKAGAAYVRRVLHRVNIEYPQLSGLTDNSGMVRWTGDCDITDFKSALAAADLEKASVIQKEPFLGNVPTTGMPVFDQWVIHKREALREDLSRALIKEIADEQNPMSEQRVKWMRHLAAHDPMNESAVRFLLEQVRTSVEAGIATLAFETLLHKLATHWGRKPLASTAELYRSVKNSAPSGGAHERPSAYGTLEAAPASHPTDHRLPAADLAAWGRELELSRLRHLLQDPGRKIISIVGLGGVGKTWLARALFREAKAQPAFEAVWVDLTAVSTRNEMLAAIAAAVGMVPRQGSLESQLAYWFGNRSTLLFLDNFEQLIEHAHVLEELFADGADVRFVITSRRPLLLGTEQRFQLQGLAWLGADSPAFRLFQLHAERAGSRIAPGDDVEALLRHLEGMPLAIEMAAAWVPLLSPAEILGQLKQDPSLVETVVDAPSAGRSIDTVLRTTWTQMGPDEQYALVAVATVLGTMDWETAQAMAAPRSSALLHLAAISVVRRDENGKYAVHPLFREFVERFAESEQLRAAKERHARYFLEKIAALPEIHPGIHDEACLKKYGDQVPNFVKAWRHCVELGISDLLEKSFPNLSGFLTMARRFEDAIELCKFSLQLLKPDSPLAEGIALLHAVSAFRAGRMPEAFSVASAGLKGECSARVRARLYSILAGVHWFYGQYDLSLLSADRAAQSLPEDDLFISSQINEQLALSHYALGDLDKADEYLKINLSRATLHQVEQLEGRSLSLLGVVRTAADRGADALPLFERALAIFRRINDAYEIGYCQRAASYAYYRARQLEQQMASAQAAVETFRDAGYYHEIGEALFAVATAYDAIGEHRHAAEASKEALLRCIVVNNEPAAMRCIGALGVFAVVSAQDNAPDEPAQSSEHASREGQPSAFNDEPVGVLDVFGKMSREVGLSIVLFALNHPSFRRRDRLIFERRMQQLAVTEDEIHKAQQDSHRWTYQSVCAELLGSNPVEAR